jgi:hypothetical protein
MPTYHVALSLTRPSRFSDADLVDILREAANRAMCEAIEVAAGGLIVDCEAAALELLEIALRTELEARGGSLDRMTATRI